MMWLCVYWVSFKEYSSGNVIENSAMHTVCNTQPKIGSPDKGPLNGCYNLVFFLWKHFTISVYSGSFALNISHWSDCAVCCIGIHYTKLPCEIVHRQVPCHTVWGFSHTLSIMSHSLNQVSSDRMATFIQFVFNQQCRVFIVVSCMCRALLYCCFCRARNDWQW